MSFTLTFSPSLATTDPITITTSESINIVFDTADNGATYTFTSSTGTITILDGFSGQTWTANLNTVTNIPSSVTSIGIIAFLSCSSLTSITIPASVTSIGDNAFVVCTSLTSITIPNSVTSIGDGAFNSSALTSITIPASVTSIGDLAFAGCPLTSIVVDPSNPNYSSLDDNLYNLAQTTIILYATAKTASSFSIPDGVTSIGDNAFYGCTSLTSITIPNSVTSIGFSPFNSCTSLSSITIPNSVISIGDLAFQNCTSLTSITIPNSVTSIGDLAFNNCTSLSSIVVDTSNPNYSSLDGNLYNLAQTTIIQYAIGKTASSFSIPDGVTSIGDNAFYGCTSLTSITIPNSVTSIGFSPFNSCTSLSSITIPNSVISIGDLAFQNCTSLTSITIPNSVTSIGDGAFQGIPNLSSTIVTTPITPSPSYAYTWFHTEPEFTNYYSNITFQDPPPYPCFKEGSKILTDKGYIPIQNLRKGYLIKTLRDGYKPLDMIGYREIENVICKERIKNKLYVCKQSEYQEIFEDLIITGCHAILVDDFKEEQREKTEEVLGNIFVTDNKYRLPACVDSKAKPYEKEGKFTIYHIALENNDYYMNYGIYANGLLVESTSKRYLKELSNMKLIE